MPRPGPVRTRGLTHLALAVRDPKRSFEFYGAVLGMEYEVEIWYELRRPLIRRSGVQEPPGSD